MPEQDRNTFKSRVKSCLYSVAGFLLVRPWKAKSPLLRRFIFNTIGHSGDTLVYSKTATEHYIVSSKDRTIGKTLFATGQFDFEKFESGIALYHEIMPGKSKPDILIDAGANVGSICIPAVARGYVKMAVAIEPDPLNCRLLRANVALNGLSDRISIHERALGAASNHRLDLALNPANLGDHRIRPSAQSPYESTAQRKIVSVETATLDELCPISDFDNCIVWMDIQGFEGFALLGAQQFLAKRVPMFLEFWPPGMKEAGSFAAFKTSISAYRGYYDLREPKQLRTPSDLDALFDELDATQGFTDILVI